MITILINFLRLTEYRMKEKYVYLFPNNLGGYFLGVVFIGFLLALGYGNNYILLFSMFNFLIFIWALFEAHLFGKNIELEDIIIPDGHVLDLLPVTFIFKKGGNDLNTADVLDRALKVTLFGNQYSNKKKYNPNNQNNKNNKKFDRITLIKTNSNTGFYYQEKKRGMFELQKVSITFKSGFGLFFVWKIKNINSKIWIYPALARTDDIAWYKNFVDVGAHLWHRSRGNDLDQIKNWDSSSSWSRLDWKKFSKDKKLQEKVTSLGVSNEVMLDFYLLEEKSEFEISQLAYKLESCYFQECRWFILRHKDVAADGPFESFEHFQLHMRELALVPSKEFE